MKKYRIYFAKYKDGEFVDDWKEWIHASDMNDATIQAKRMCGTGVRIQNIEEIKS